MRFDTPLTELDKKKVIILFRAKTLYHRDTVESTVRFLGPRVPPDNIEKSLGDEWPRALGWWTKLQPAEQFLLDRQYRFAAKVVH